MLEFVNLKLELQLSVLQHDIFPPFPNITGWFVSSHFEVHFLTITRFHVKYP